MSPLGLKSVCPSIMRRIDVVRARFDRDSHATRLFPDHDRDHAVTCRLDHGVRQNDAWTQQYCAPLKGLLCEYHTASVVFTKQTFQAEALSHYLTAHELSSKYCYTPERIGCSSSASKCIHYKVGIMYLPPPGGCILMHFHAFRAYKINWNNDAILCRLRLSIFGLGQQSSSKRNCQMQAIRYLNQNSNEKVSWFDSNLNCLQSFLDRMKSAKSIIFEWFNSDQADLGPTWTPTLTRSWPVLSWPADQTQTKSLTPGHIGS